MCQGSRTVTRPTAEPHPLCRTPPSRSSQTPGTPRHSASPPSARPHCILCGGSETSGLSLSWAVAPPWPRAWWGRPEKGETDGKLRVNLGPHSILAFSQHPTPKRAPSSSWRGPVSGAGAPYPGYHFPAEASRGYWDNHTGSPRLLLLLTPP